MAKYCNGFEMTLHLKLVVKNSCFYFIYFTINIYNILYDIKDIL